jgi:carboxyl-terminal processing protease
MVIEPNRRYHYCYLIFSDSVAIIMRNILILLFLLASLLVGAVAEPLFAKSSDSIAAQATSDKPADTKPADKADKNDKDANDTYKQLELFSDVLARVRNDYVDTVTDEKLIETALNGMLSSLDPHSSYLNKKNFQEMQTQTKGEFGGLGLEVTMENGIVKVISPIDDTPAAKAGIQSGDLITHIDGKLVTELSLNEAVDRMRGPPGTKVTLTIRHGGLSGQPSDFSLTRAVIHVQSVRWEAKDNIAYIRLTAFNEQTQPGLDKALDEAEQKLGAKLEGYVLDLRNNPGGLLEQAISVSGTFLQPGLEVVSTRGRHKEENQSYVAKEGDKTHGKPIAILVNGGSASASEIVAGALQDHKRAIIVGQKSFGKGSVQTIIPVAGGGAMRLTTARYYTPSGRSIQALGIEPDITVQPAKLEKIATGPGLHEADLKGALINDTLKTDKDKSKDAATSTKPSDDDNGDNSDASADDMLKGAKGSKDKDKNAPPFDYQLARALDLIHGVHVFQSK